MLEKKFDLQAKIDFRKFQQIIRQMREIYAVSPANPARKNNQVHVQTTISLLKNFRS